MTPEQFTYWLQGFVEMHPDGLMIDTNQWKMVKDHLQTVFKKITPEPYYRGYRDTSGRFPENPEPYRATCQLGPDDVLLPKENRVTFTKC